MLQIVSNGPIYRDTDTGRHIMFQKIGDEFRASYHASLADAMAAREGVILSSLAFWDKALSAYRKRLVNPSRRSVKQRGNRTHVSAAH